MHSQLLTWACSARCVHMPALLSCPLETASPFCRAWAPYKQCVVHKGSNAGRGVSWGVVVYA